MADEDRKLDTIRKLLAKAERAGSPAEADTYNTKAAEMMATHGIDAAMLAAAGATTDAITSRRIAMTDPYSKEKATLAGGIAMALNCRIVSHPGRSRGQIEAVTVLGYASDLARMELTYTSLLLQATRSVARQRPPAWSGESTAAFRRSYLIGFTAEVHRRLSDAGDRAVRDHSSGDRAALVLADRGSQVDHALRAMFPTRRTPAKRRLTGSGYHDGVAAGARADVGHTRLGRQRRELGHG